jgi:hypothetical protein
MLGGEGEELRAPSGTRRLRGIWVCEGRSGEKAWSRQRRDERAEAALFVGDGDGLIE